uniref:HET domain-containing protein n=1 Tax=Heligmosomoides polygyrus TaxID=6339 RepID=A0A183GGM3_HELPZ
LNSFTNSDVASTSRESTPSIEIAPCLYEDPFVAVTMDGLIFVKNYNVYNQRAEFHGESIVLPYVQRVSRVLKISRLRTIYYASPTECQDTQACKPWGITCNDVWWASHLNRYYYGFEDRFSLDEVECLLQVDERKAQRQLVLSRHFDELRNGVYIVDHAESSPKSRLLAWLSFVQRSADPIQDDSIKQLVDYGQQADRAIVANVVHVSLLVQQDGPAGLPLRWNLAFRQIA